MTPAEARTLARKIARRLFTNCIGQKADLLAMYGIQSTGRRGSLGTWDEKIVVEEIEFILIATPHARRAKGAKRK